MPGLYEHIHIERESPIRDYRPSGGFPRVNAPDDVGEHGRRLLEGLDRFRAEIPETPTGFDPRRLVKVNLDQPIDPRTFESISGVEFVSQESDSLAVLFSTEEALSEFESRLTTYSRGEKVVRAELFHALQSFDHVTAEDRTGRSLKEAGIPEEPEFGLDVELWPIENVSERRTMMESFEEWLENNGMSVLDSLMQESLILVRVRTDRESYKKLLIHRDVRTVERLPRFAMDASLVNFNTQELPPVSSPSEAAPRVCIVDSGVNTGHPLLGPAMGDSGSFVDELGPEDDANHGTAVAGITLYGNLEHTLNADQLTPEMWLISAKILDRNGAYDGRLIQNQISEVVERYVSEYNCRIFNLSIGDIDKPYGGGRLGALAVTLDTLARQFGVLFVVSAGNLGKLHVGELLRDGKHFPDFLLSDAPLIDPATAVNVLTVGSLARYEVGRPAARYPNDPAYRPIATRDSVSPFSRTGPSIRGAIKPDLADYGGNFVRDARTGRVQEHGLGEISTRSDFVDGGPLGDFCGTSFAAPHVTNLAARLTVELPEASHNLIRAILVGHARVPAPVVEQTSSPADITRFVGYGQVDAEFLMRSNEDVVTLYAEGSIENKKNHFYSLPVPEQFTRGHLRTREITVVMAFSPSVRTTRVDYTASRLFFRLVHGSSLESIVPMFDKQTSDEDYEKISEFSPGSRNHGPKMREKSTVQAATWTMRRPQSGQYFLVVTRNDRGWASAQKDAEEPYALAVILRDRENAEARIYTRIQEMLRQRVRVSG